NAPSRTVFSIVAAASRASMSFVRRSAQGACAVKLCIVMDSHQNRLRMSAVEPRSCSDIQRGATKKMTQHRLGIIMNGATGRMGMNQHLIRSIVAIRAAGGVALKNGDKVMPDPILVGRNEARLAQLAKANGIARWTTDLNGALKNREDTLFFDAATTK